MIFDSEALSQCVGCGFCLPACPTYQVTYKEQHGPRGRIAGMRLVQNGAIEPTDEGYLESMETCVQCRACEPACPSGVQFGRLMEQARSASYKPRGESRPAEKIPARLQAILTDLGLRCLTSRGLLRSLTVLLSFAQGTRLDRLLPRAYRVWHRVRLRDWFRPLESRTGAELSFLFRGCVMDAWFGATHQATTRLLAAAGYSVRSTPAPACCGALHLHAGREAEGKRLAQLVVDAYRGTSGFVVVNSAGCGATMREYGVLLGTAEAQDFAARVRDIAEVASPERLPSLAPIDRVVVYQAACHLKNVQRVDPEIDALLMSIPGLTVLRPQDGELCCGAGGAYSLMQPGFASKVRENKVKALTATEASQVVSGNPGCMLHLAAAGLDVVHIADFVASALPEAKVEQSQRNRSTMTQG